MRLFKPNEVDDQRYFKIPKSLFGNPNYKGLLPEAKLIYAFLRDRMELSNKNGWINEQGNIYLLFTRTNIAELLEMSLPSVTKCFKQLNEYKLIKEVRQGLGKPNIIFVAHIELDKVISQKQTFLMSGNKQSLHQDTKDICANDTDVSDTDFNETENIRHFSGKNVCTLSIKGKTLFDFYCRYYEAYTGEQHKPYMVKKYFSNNYNCDRNINHFLVTKWCLSNVSVQKDRNDNWLPCKVNNQRRRNDGFAAMLDAMVVFERHQEDYLSMI